MSKQHAQTFVTRSASQYVALAIALPIGVVLLWATWTDVMVNGTDASFFAAFVFGALFCFAALAVLHGIVFPVEWRGTVDGECIRCYKNGVLKSEFARSDIDYVNVSALLDHSSHWIRLKDGRDLRLTKLYFEDYRKLEAALAEFAYPLKSAGVK